MEEQSTAERLKQITTRNFSITKCPEVVYEEFVKFCREETNDNYSMGLKLLLAYKEENVVQKVIFQELDKLNAEIEAIKAKDMPKEEAKPKGPKTFGSK